MDSTEGANGLSLQEIAYVFNVDGVPSARGGWRCSGSTIAGVLAKESGYREVRGRMW